MAAKQLGTTLLAAIVAFAPHTLFADKGAADKAKDTLKRVLLKQRRVANVRIESRPDSHGEMAFNLKVQTEPSRGVKVTIIAPLSQAGIVSIDDTKILKTYDPNQKRLIEMPSPTLLQPSMEWRIKQIDKNYRVTFGRGDEIAGQSVRELVLRPLAEDMPVRRMFVDTNHDIALRYVISTEGSDRMVFDTKYIQFGTAAAGADFDMPAAAEDARHETREGPKATVRVPEDARKLTGFAARLPSNLPYGFKVSGASVFGRRSQVFVSVRISDGMATFSVLQWKPTSTWKGPRPEPRHVIEDSYGVSYGVSSVQFEPLPDVVIEELLEAFRGGND
ncbi:MAG: hypothetical protein JSS66_18180 [Armatimonadetes bacterium]|nr:hypothetical protein [Armatimonadota bacterium]